MPEELNLTSVTPQEEGSWKLEPGLLGMSLHMPFPSADAVVLSHSPEPNYVHSL